MGKSTGWVGHEQQLGILANTCTSVPPTLLELVSDGYARQPEEITDRRNKSKIKIQRENKRRGEQLERKACEKQKTEH